jgi:hypothetical protein
MSRGFKPGDVALVEGEVMLRRTDGRWEHGDQLRFPIYSDDARPLVVIDPEDREQVETLRIAYHAQRMTATGGTSFDDMQAALRSLVAPPKPEEPQGLGAVVEDAEGTLWAYTGEEYAWASNGGARHWHELDVARVLSDGWTPDAPGGAS